MKRILLAFCFLSFILIGCNPDAKQEINNQLLNLDKQTIVARNNINQAQQLIQTSKSYQQDLNLQKADNNLDVAKIAVNKIETYSLNAREELPGIENKEDLWSKWSKTLRWVIPIIVILGAAMYFGVGKFIRPIFNAFGWWVDKKTKRAAQIDAKLLDPDNPMSVQEAVAARRASLEGYEAVLKKERKRLEELKKEKQWQQEQEKKIKELEEKKWQELQQENVIKQQINKIQKLQEEINSISTTNGNITNTTIDPYRV